MTFYNSAHEMGNIMLKIARRKNVETNFQEPIPGSDRKKEVICKLNGRDAKLPVKVYVRPAFI